MKQSGMLVHKKWVVRTYKILRKREKGWQHTGSCSNWVVDAASSAKSFLSVVLQLAVSPIWRNQRLKDQVNRRLKRVELIR